MPWLRQTSPKPHENNRIPIWNSQQLVVNIGPGITIMFRELRAAVRREQSMEEVTKSISLLPLEKDSLLSKIGDQRYR